MALFKNTKIKTFESVAAQFQKSIDDFNEVADAAAVTISNAEIEVIELQKTILNAENERTKARKAASKIAEILG